MGYFKSAGEVYEYIGGALRQAGEDALLGPRLRAVNLTLQLAYSDPESYLTVRLRQPYEVIDGGRDAHADVSVSMPADIAHSYWRGEFNVGVGLANGQVTVTGPISKILKLGPVTKPLFPLYRQITDDRDRRGRVATLGDQMLNRGARRD
jgi:hypothetical protein